jgi:thiamine-phosphate pyrophosphorylase
VATRSRIRWMLSAIRIGGSVIDGKLIAWARAVKARQGRGRASLPPLWIFTDRERLPDPRDSLAGLPKGLCGVVMRLDGGDRALALAVARVCVQRRFRMVAAAELGLPGRLGVGRHLSRGRLRRGRTGLVTTSAHSLIELHRGSRLGVDAVFLSPVFPTASHPGAPALGVLRWVRLARVVRGPVMALGGITSATVRRLPRRCAGAGVIGAVGGLAFQRPAG